MIASTPCALHSARMRSRSATASTSSWGDLQLLALGRRDELAQARDRERLDPVDVAREGLDTVRAQVELDLVLLVRQQDRFAGVPDDRVLEARLDEGEHAADRMDALDALGAAILFTVGSFVLRPLPHLVLEGVHIGLDEVARFVVGVLAVNHLPIDALVVARVRFDAQRQILPHVLPDRGVVEGAVLGQQELLVLAVGDHPASHPVLVEVHPIEGRRVQEPDQVQAAVAVADAELGLHAIQRGTQGKDPGGDLRGGLDEELLLASVG